MTTYDIFLYALGDAAFTGGFIYLLYKTITFFNRH